MSDDLFSLKMRASREEKHISGAEKILEEKELPSAMELLLNRAMNHANGIPDFVNFKVERVKREDVLHLNALPVSEINADSPEEAMLAMRKLLEDSGVRRAAEIVEMLKNARGMRGAMLLNAETLERLEPDRTRGVRATLMDKSRRGPESPEKNHFEEAVILAAKVANAPGIIAELCISDDPDYLTGYFASRQAGYVRISPVKLKGDPAGGRIFLCSGECGIGRTIRFLEKQPVLVHGIPKRDQQACETISDRIGKTLVMLREKNLHREETVFDSPSASHVSIQGKDFLMFASNNYLDLANEKRVKRAAAEAVLKFGAGSGGSRLTTGTQEIHRKLERSLAEFKGTEDSVVFNTGFAANSGIISAVCTENDVIFSDELNHASIIDGCRLSRAKIIVYRHNDMGDLERKLRETPFRSGLLVSDAVFSMDGDILNLPDWMELARKYNLFTMVDEAHSTGVTGTRGHGILEHFNWTGPLPDLIMGTLSKALGSEGGFVCSSKANADFLRNRARSYIFSTSMPAGCAAAALESLRILREEPRRVTKLRENVRFLTEYLNRFEIRTGSESAIIPVILGENGEVMKIAAKLRKHGIIVSPIRYPSVPPGAARLRIAVMSSHTEPELKFLAETLSDLLREA